MSYTSIHTTHSVGDTVYFHEPAADAVHRCVVTGIEAKSVTPAKGAKIGWEVLYTVIPLCAGSPPKSPYLIGDAFLKDNPRDAFPEIVRCAGEVMV